MVGLERTVLPLIAEHDFQIASKDPREFYAQFAGRVIVGFETSGYSAWFETMLEQLEHKVWIGHATEIRRRARQKTDRRDAELILDLLLKDEFPRQMRC